MRQSLLYMLYRRHIFAFRHNISTDANPRSRRVSRKSVVRVTKRLDQLPTSLAHDGEPVLPLPPFDGGLEPSPRRRTRRTPPLDAHSLAAQSSSNNASPSSPEAAPSDSGSGTTFIQAERPNGKRAFVEIGAASSNGSSELVSRQPGNTLAREIRANLKRFPRAILLTKVGQFYESYFEQAAEVAQLLSIKLTSRKWDGLDVLMAGFPVLQIDRHLKTLVQMHRRSVALCEEFRSDGNSGAFVRKVNRIVTPGTLIDEPFLNPFENNYLLSIAPNVDSDTLGLAWTDISTGEFFTDKVPVRSLQDAIARIGPKEIVLSNNLEDKVANEIRLSLRGFPCLVSSTDAGSEDNQQVDKIFHDDAEPSKGLLSLTDEESHAASLLVTFLRQHLLEHMPTQAFPWQRNPGNRVEMDAQTIEALEIRETLQERGPTGSLLSCVNRTVTCSGTRLLSRWLCSPSSFLPEIKARQEVVALFTTNGFFLADIVRELRTMEDSRRVVQKLLLGKGEPEDLLSMRDSIMLFERIRVMVDAEAREEAHIPGPKDQWQLLTSLVSKMVNLEPLAARISQAVHDAGSRKRECHPDETPGGGLRSLGSPPYGPHWKLKPEVSPNLCRLHENLAGLIVEKADLENRWRSEHGTASLTLRASPSLGFHVHLSKAKRDGAKLASVKEFVTLQLSNTTQAYQHSEWSTLGAEIASTIEQVCNEEKQAFDLLRGDVVANHLSIRKNCSILDELDVLTGFARLASEMSYVMPQIVEQNVFSIRNGRHPTVEYGLQAIGRTFVPNSIEMNTTSRIHLITGPNMAGKSTLLRQVALIAILAQTGSFVPADQATLGVVDKVFSRVGAKDDLFRGRSTFMVEMLETANILNNATARSLVIMDEVGRGTSVNEGIALAFATVYHLYHINGCCGLFATHFHELADMLGYGESPSAFPHIGFFCSDVNEMEDRVFSYSYKLTRGVNRDSHGLKVAGLSGMPLGALKMAATTLDWLNSRPPSGRRDGSLLSAASPSHSELPAEDDPGSPC